MRSVREGQRGATFLGILLIAAMIALVAYVGVKLIPVYLENFGVTSSLRALAEEEGVANAPAGEIRSRLMRRLSVNDVENVRPENITVRNVGQSRVVSVEYEVRTRFYGNLYLVMDFSDSAVLTGN